MLSTVKTTSSVHYGMHYFIFPLAIIIFLSVIFFFNKKFVFENFHHGVLVYGHKAISFELFAL